VQKEIEETAEREGKRPIVFITLVNDEVRQVIARPDSKGLVLDTLCYSISSFF
jgi:hypothetical protein